MPQNQKLLLEILGKYCVMVNAQLEQILYRLKVAETAIQSRPDLVVAYTEATAHTKRQELPGLPRQLLAFLEEVQKIPDRT